MARPDARIAQPIPSQKGFPLGAGRMRSILCPGVGCSTRAQHSDMARSNWASETPRRHSSRAIVSSAWTGNARPPAQKAVCEPGPPNPAAPVFGGRFSYGQERSAISHSASTERHTPPSTGSAHAACTSLSVLSNACATRRCLWVSVWCRSAFRHNQTNTLNPVPDNFVSASPKAHLAANQPVACFSTA